MNISWLMCRNLQLSLNKILVVAVLLSLQQACSTDNETALAFDPALTNRLGTPTAPNNEPPDGVDPNDSRYWIINGGVENGVVPWQYKGDDVNIAQSSEYAYLGEHSLLVTGRNDTWHGPEMRLPLNLPTGQTYRASVWVRLVDGEQPATIKLTLQTRTESQTSENYNTLSQGVVTDSEWVRVSGTFTHQPTAPMANFLLYIESDNPTVSFYVDELSLTLVDTVEPAPGPSEWIINGGVEEGIFPWRSLGDGVTLHQADEQARGGDYSLLVSGRTLFWHAAVMDLPKTLPVDREYRVSVWVRLAPDTPAVPIGLTLKKDFGQEDPYFEIATHESVTDSEWVEVVGTFVHEFFDGALEDFYLYIESEEGSASYYVDDLSMAYADELIINGDLETDTDGWEPFGEVTITHTDADASSGSYSLLVSDRNETWQGASFTFESLLSNHLYEFSCWVKMAPEQESSSLTLSLKIEDAEGEGYPTIDSTSVTSDGWVLLTGSYSPGDDVTVELGYVQSDRATASYYIDNCSVVEREHSESIATLWEGRL